MNSTQASSIQRPNGLTIGKYLVSPLTRRLADGGYAASVSIRSGQGQGTHDRVIRFAGRFASHRAAAHYAAAQGVKWVREPDTRCC